jgi:hypothetical protein
MASPWKLLASACALTSSVQAYAPMVGGAPHSAHPLAVRAVGTSRVAASPAANIQRAVGHADGPQKRISADETYRVMFKTLFDTENKISDEVTKNYALFDYGFMQRLEVMRAEAAPGSAEAARLAEVAEALSHEMSRRMAEAAETLRAVLQSPSAIVMEGKMTGLARQGKIDDALLQLLEANLQQARAAGEAGKPAVAALTKLQGRVQEEVDKILPPDVQLLRRLLRMDSKPARIELLKDKMSPKRKSSVVIAGSVKDAAKIDLEKQADGAPEVDPRALAQAFKNLKVRQLRQGGTHVRPGIDRGSEQETRRVGVCEKGTRVFRSRNCNCRVGVGGWWLLSTALGGREPPAVHAGGGVLGLSSLGVGRAIRLRPASPCFLPSLVRCFPQARFGNVDKAYSPHAHLPPIPPPVHPGALRQCG